MVLGCGSVPTWGKFCSFVHAELCLLWSLQRARCWTSILVLLLSVFMTARRYCDLSCWLVGSFICLFPSMLVRLLTSGHRLLWPAAGGGWWEDRQQVDDQHRSGAVGAWRSSVLYSNFAGYWCVRLVTCTVVRQSWCILNAAIAATDTKTTDTAITNVHFCLNLQGELLPLLEWDFLTGLLPILMPNQ